ncbi:MAG: DUF6687 family protein [Iamia sp.]
MTLNPVTAWHIDDGTSPVPAAERVLYADGAAGDALRPGVDLELSHWVPTTTPDRWAADTSTETCLRFVDDPPHEHYDLAVNNHLDVDGILSLFVLTHPDLASTHRTTVVGAAEMGDFSAGVDRPAFVLAQELTALMGRARETGATLTGTYRSAFERAQQVLAGEGREATSVSDGWHQLERGAERVADGTVAVEQVGEHLVAYVLPALDGTRLEGALRVPPHNALVDESVWLWPHVRNRDHGECVQLTSIPVADGWFHDLWLPGYTWAHTPDRWRSPWARSTGDSNVWAVQPAVARAATDLQGAERGPGTWLAAEQLTPFSGLAGRGFPVVLSYVDARRRPAPSTLPPATVAEAVGSLIDIAA